MITGKITDADGKPLIEEYVTVLPIETSYMTVRYEGSLRTDDRGIYRAFGLRRGKYKVFVGHDDSLPGGTRPSYRQTFYPSVTDIAKATVIDVTEGSETTNVDIVTGRPVTTLKSAVAFSTVKQGSRYRKSGMACIEAGGTWRLQHYWGNYYE